jgi:hypothetical protein
MSDKLGRLIFRCYSPYNQAYSKTRIHFFTTRDQRRSLRNVFWNRYNEWIKSFIKIQFLSCQSLGILPAVSIDQWDSQIRLATYADHLGEDPLAQHVAGIKLDKYLY